MGSRTLEVGVIGVPYNVGWRSPRIDEGARAFRDAGLVDELENVIIDARASRSLGLGLLEVSVSG